MSMSWCLLKDLTSIKISSPIMGKKGLEFYWAVNALRKRAPGSTGITLWESSKLMMKKIKLNPFRSKLATTGFNGISTMNLMILLWRRLTQMENKSKSLSSIRKRPFLSANWSMKMMFLPSATWPIDQSDQPNPPKSVLLLPKNT